MGAKKYRFLTQCHYDPSGATEKIILGVLMAIHTFGRNLKRNVHFHLSITPLSKKWVAHLSKPYANHQRNIQYVGRYLKKPPISEARILNYNESEVTYCAIRTTRKRNSVRSPCPSLNSLKDSFHISPIKTLE